MTGRSTQYHTPVLSNEVLSYLLTSPGGVYVDATLGGGGHTEAILAHCSSTATVIGIDADQDALRFASERLQRYGNRFQAIAGNYGRCGELLKAVGLSSVSGFLFDLGVSSFQLDEPSKGFSYREHAPLDLRMDATQPLDGRSVVNNYSEHELATLLWQYGEERASRRIARAIVRKREQGSIQSTTQLVTLVKASVGEQHLVKSLARVFQALRIEVNNELENLKLGLAGALALLTSGGRIVVISYHSLEDRIVKEAFKHAAAKIKPSGHKLVPDEILQPTVMIVTKKPIEPSVEEIRINPRARSAKLRAAEKI
ncbi:MAG: 16S rRNA (cytosine(1402)-N(4))-methyltransferase RsmH [bacterium]